MCCLYVVPIVFDRREGWSLDDVLVSSSHVVALLSVELHQLAIKVVSDAEVQISLCRGSLVKSGQK